MSFSIHTAENAVRLLMMQGEKEPTEICRRLFHADMLHLSKYGRSILRDTYTRQGTTPIPQRTAAALSNPDFDPKEYDGDYLSVSDVECLKASTAEGTAQTQKAIGDTPDGCTITTETMLRAMGEDDGFIDYVLEQEELERWLSGKTKL